MKVALLALASFAVFAIATPIVPRADSGTIIENFMDLTEQARSLAKTVDGLNPLTALGGGLTVLDGLQNMVNTASETALNVASPPQTVFSDGAAAGVFDFIALYVRGFQDLLEALNEKEMTLYFYKAGIASRLMQLGREFDNINTGLIPLIAKEADAVGRQFMEISRSLNATVAVYST
ncbi:hypothetical protein EXIGLDRAFT_844466 [Exidia glandulosa HHB12029]|uniref:Hydrophobic surface binding protein A n=1 Tax=Exidia glandulosa HHB12029 TaxID=1314781 RepID=A0A165C136_EXIGL|nr:hypothetical protein EXIGLDRAFT_844466 [Exidia glandulosa HHB12029]